MIEFAKTAFRGGFGSRLELTINLYHRQELA
jgi:hypothetical protein